MATKLCPNCARRKDIATEICHCGYDFVSGRMGTPEPAPTEATTDNPQAVVTASSEGNDEITSNTTERKTSFWSRSKKYFLLWGGTFALVFLLYLKVGAGCFETCAVVLFGILVLMVIVTAGFVIYDFHSWLARSKGLGGGEVNLKKWWPLYIILLPALGYLTLIVAISWFWG